MAESINQRQFEVLKSHKYTVEGVSLLEKHLLCHFWNFLIKFVPLTWAPNAITLVGVVFMIVPFIGLMLADPQGKGEKVAGWFFFMAFGLFVFQTLDNLDGRQARRTNSCSPLGEFFDHGCDTISDSCMSLSLLLTQSLAANPNLFLVMGLSIIQDYGFFWRAHWTGKYVFGDIDVSEIQWIAITMLVTTGCFPNIWSTSVFGVVQLKTIISCSYFIFSLYYLGDCFQDAIRVGFLEKNRSQTEKENVMYPMVTLLLNMALTVAARFLAPDTYDMYPVAFIFIYILVLAKLSSRLLISNLTKQRMVIFDSSMLAYSFLLLSNKAIAPTLLLIKPSAAIFMAMAFSAFDFLKYTVLICGQLADFLGIYWFSLGKQPKNE